MSRAASWMCDEASKDAGTPARGRARKTQSPGLTHWPNVKDCASGWGSIPRLHEGFDSGARFLGWEIRFFLHAGSGLGQVLVLEKFSEPL